MDKKAFQNIQKKLNLTNERVSEALDVELFTVRMWACGTWLVPRAMAKFLRSLLSTKMNNEVSYMLGYGKGHKEGYDEGYDEGYSEGYRLGRVEEQWAARQ